MDTSLLTNFTTIITVITALVSILAFRNRKIFQQGVFHPVTVKEHGQWHRFISHSFLHGSPLHLFVNLFVFWQFGRIVEIKFIEYFDGVGAIVYVVFYFTAVAAAAVPDYIRHKDNPQYSAVGASGAVAAVLFSYLFFGPWENIYLYALIPIPGILLGVLYLAYEYYMDKRGGGRIAHMAHFAGAVYGIVFTVVVALILNAQLLTEFYRMLISPKFLQ